MLRSEQIVPAGIDEVWKFFTHPKNLDRITPNDMKFKITSDVAPETYPGQIISYKIEILPGITRNWITEITHLSEKKLFVDEQRFGPYAMWHHEHHFTELPDGTVLMTDVVTYKLPLGILGNWLAGKWVRNRIQQIFEHRFDVISQIFSNK